MAIGRKLLAGGLTALTLLVTTAAASAAPAYATSNVNVRSGPSTGYSVVDTLRRGERVDIQYCRGSWCFIEKRGPDGWVSSNYLGRDHDRYDPPRPPRWDPPPRPPRWDPPPRPPRWDRPHHRPPHYYDPRPSYPDRSGSSVCFSGPNGYFCAGD